MRLLRELGVSLRFAMSVKMTCPGAVGTKNIPAESWKDRTLVRERSMDRLKKNDVSSELVVSLVASALGRVSYLTGGDVYD